MNLRSYGLELLIAFPSLVGLSLENVSTASLRVSPQTWTNSSCALNVKLNMFYNIIYF